MKFLLLTILVLPFLIYSISAASLKNSREVKKENAIVEIPQGRLVSNILTSRDNREYYAFYKVPYSKPPLGGLRFASPQAPEPWEGLRNETEVAPQCLQKLKYSPIIEAGGEEDCLYVNIYSPKLPGVELEPNETLPTLFYIHGGGFSDGNGSRYGAKYFMDEDAVMITFQYRLGALGFLSSEDGTIKGNMGMKDQVQALKWVKDNIKYFGGNPDNVMIFGNSAGGMSVNLLLASPMSAGLYQRAITQSGPAVGSALTRSKEGHLKSYEDVAKALNCWSTNNTQVLECLRQQNASDVAVIRGDDVFYTATVESYESEDESDKFLPDSIYNMWKTQRINKVPWMVGVNNAEWVANSAFTLTNLEIVNALNTNWLETVPHMFIVPYLDSASKDVISNKIKDFYFEDKQVGNETFWNFTYMSQDRDIIHGSKFQGAWMSEFGVDVFFYYLSKRPAKSYSDGALIGYPPGDYGASHADELQYLFNYYGYPEYLEDSDYYQFSKSIIKLWVQFAATGETGWDAVKPGVKPIPYYELNDNPGYTIALEERMAFWDQFTDEELCYT